MRHLSTAFAMAAVLAAAGCASEEARHEAAKQSVKAVLADAGFPRVAFQSVSEDGSGRLVMTGVTATSDEGVTLTLKKLSFFDPEIDPMLVRWYDFGKIEVGGWVLYGGHGAKPTGFVASKVKAEDVTVATAESLKAKTDVIEIAGWDSTRKRGFRYDGYTVAGAVLEAGGTKFVSIGKAEVKAAGWLDGLASPLKSSTKAEGSLILPASGVMSFLPEALRPEITFVAEGVSDVDLKTSRASLSGSIATEGLGKLSFELKAGGVGRELLDALAEASRPAKGKPAAKAPAKPDKKKEKGGKSAAPAKADPPAPDPAAAAKVIAASAAVSLEDLRIEGEGLGWLGPAIDDTFGSRETLANWLVSVVDRGFGLGDRSDEAEASLAALMLFLREPSSFTLVLEPETPFVFAEKDMGYYLNNASGPLRALGFRFRNSAGD